MCSLKSWSSSFLLRRVNLDRRTRRRRIERSEPVENKKLRPAICEATRRS